METPMDEPVDDLPTNAAALRWMRPWRKERTCSPVILLSVLGYIYWEGEGDVFVRNLIVVCTYENPLSGTHHDEGLWDDPGNLSGWWRVIDS